MSFTIDSHSVLVRDVKVALSEAARAKDWTYTDNILYVSGVFRSDGLRSIVPTKQWRRDWKLMLREDGKLCLVYFHEAAGPVRSRIRSPFRERAFGISLGPFWRMFSRVRLTQIRYHLSAIIDPLYAGYNYPFRAFPTGSGRE